MTTKKNKGGRPMKFKSPEDLQTKIDEYYKWAKDNDKHITITGLAWYLDTDRITLLRYEDMINNNELYKEIDESVKVAFSNTIKRAKNRIEMECEEGLYNKNSVVGTIFALKNNYGYVDKQEVEQTNKTIEVKLED